jgi:hypothetical protein
VAFIKQLQSDAFLRRLLSTILGLVKMRGKTNAGQNECWPTNAGQRMLAKECWPTNAGKRMLAKECWQKKWGNEMGQ